MIGSPELLHAFQRILARLMGFESRTGVRSAEKTWIDIFFHFAVI